MSQFFNQILDLIARGKVQISAHGYTELEADGILFRDILASVNRAVVIEEYPTYPKGPCVLALQQDNAKKPIHVLWGIPKGKKEPAVLITAYRPKADKWSNDFTRRIK